MPRGCQSALACKFSLDDSRSSQRDFVAGCPNVLALSASCEVWPFFKEKSFGSAAVECCSSGSQGSASNLASLLVSLPKRSSHARSQESQDNAEVHRKELEVVAADAVHQMQAVFEGGRWCRCLQFPGCPPLPSGPLPCLGRGEVQIRTRRLSGRAKGTVYRVSRSDEVVASTSQFPYF